MIEECVRKPVNETENHVVWCKTWALNRMAMELLDKSERKLFMKATGAIVKMGYVAKEK